MYECEIVVAEDFDFNHYIHHIDEYESDVIEFHEQFKGLEVLSDIDDSLIWD